MSLIATYDRLADHFYDRASALIAPETRNSHYTYAERLREALAMSGRWLDIGCGHDFLPGWMAPSARRLPLDDWTVVGVDPDRRAIARHPGLSHRVVSVGEQMPFDNDSFDLVTASMVLEHVAAPARLFAEISRVLAPGGRVIIHTANVHGYTTAVARLLPECAVVPLASVLLRRRTEDVYPTYYRANSVEDLRTLATESRLAIEACELINSSPQSFRIPPLAVVELVVMRWLRSPRAAKYRACLLATLRKTSLRFNAG